MYDPQRRVAVPYVVDQDPESEQVVYLTDLFVLLGVGLYLLVDAVDVLGTARYLRFDLRTRQLFFEDLDYAMDILLAYLSLIAE